MIFDGCMALGFDDVVEGFTSGFAQNSSADYIGFLVLSVFLVVVLLIFKRFIIGYLKKLSRKSKNDIDDIVIDFLDHINFGFYAFIAIAIAAHSLVLPAFIDTAIKYAVVMVLVFYTVKAMHKVIDYVVKKQIDKRHEEDKTEDTSLIRVLGRVVKIVINIIAALVILSNVGFNISSLIAGVGIGGIAIAFALQNILQDLFSSFSIYFDKPFKIGDFIVIGDDMGVVEHIGLKSTRIKALKGQELIVSNKELTSTRINNYKRMEKRRIVFSFGVEYGTPLKKLKKIESIAQMIFEKIEKADLDRIHFSEFGDFSLNFEVVYYVKTNNYAKYMDIQQEVNFALKEAFEKQKIEFAFPTQTLFVKKAK